ncbi:MAG: NAD(P)/FAD-dependent oxidoreductase [Candidatus Micrarchaeota archaeon]
MSTERREIVVVGAGPAGLAAAKVLGEMKKDVLVLEKNKTIGKKVCAGGLTMKAKCMVHTKLFERVFSSAKIRTPRQTVEIRAEEPFVFMVDREKLGAWMADVARRAGAEIRKGAAVREVGKNFVAVDGEKIHFDYLVGADGSNSVVRKYLGLRRKGLACAIQYVTHERFDELEFFFDYDKFGPWYAWIFPHKNYTSIGTGGDPRFVDVRWLRKNLDMCCADKLDIGKARFEGAPINYDYRGFEFGNIFLVGDAAGFTSGLTGEGMYHAMVSGIEVANKIVDKKYQCEGIAQILKVKRAHEKFLWLTRINGYLTKFGFEAFALALRFGFARGFFVSLLG